jgi:hypothetical protein
LRCLSKLGLNLLLNIEFENGRVCYCLGGDFMGCSPSSYSFCHFLQALYFCVPFREQLLEYYGNNKSLADAEENLLTCLADLFSQVISL